MSINNPGIVRGIGSMIIHNMCRGDEDLNILREYIDNNPVKWQSAENYLESQIAKDGFRTRPYVAFDTISNKYRYLCHHNL